MDEVKQYQRYLIICTLAVFIIGLLLGALGAFVVISMPLTDIYTEKYNELTKNGTLKCFDATNMTDPILVDIIKIGDYCRANYCSNYQLIGNMPRVK